jgi:endonuclease/exonuclease/phosphatase family metal-dependent hydrolase
MLYYLGKLILLAILYIIFNQRTVCEYSKPIQKNRKKRNNLIITYNIQKFPWSFKTFAAIKKLLRKHSIILLQECFDDTYSTLQYNFPSYYICRDRLKGFNFLGSGLVILSKFPITDYSSYTFKNMNHCTFDRLSQKGFLVCWVKINNEKVCVINTHLQSSDYNRYDKYALLQLEELLQYVKKIKGVCIVGGDFNIDITDIMNNIKKYRTLVYNYPVEPTIYIDFKTGKSISSYKEGYDMMTFDYFITKKCIIKKPNTVPNNYSDHNPVSGLLECNNYN